MESNPTIVLNSNQCKYSSVTVFKDRAEILRNISFQPSQNGNYEIKITHLCNSIDADSFRVKSLPSITIIEVTNEEVYEVASTENTAGTENDLKQKIKNLQKEIKLLDLNIQRLQDEKEILQLYTKNTFSSTKTQQSIEGDIFHLQDAIAVMKFHSEKLSQMDIQEFDINEKKSQLSDELSILKNKLSNFNRETKASHSKTFNQFTIFIKITDFNNLVTIENILQFSYVVKNASWYPTYDIRIDSKEKIATMTLIYFANITQSTGEDWKDCELYLSTSDPAIGSSPPSLPLKVVSFFSGISYNHSDISKSKMSFRMSSNNNYDSYDDDSYRKGSFALIDETDSVQLSGANTSNNHINSSNNNNRRGNNENSASLKNMSDTSPTVFIIRQKSNNIASDNKPHKVIIAELLLMPQIIHYVAPALSTSVYLQAKTRNDSDFPLLPSNKVAIYLDGSFVSISSIAITSPNELFTVYLGVDPSFKAEYLPCKISDRVRGWLSGSNAAKVYSYTTILHNTKSQPYRVIIAEILPLSKNDKIIVELKSPSPSSLTKPSEDAIVTSGQDILANLDYLANNSIENSDSTSSNNSFPSDFISLNKATNSVVWLKTIQPGEKVQIQFSYQITYPQGTTIKIN